MVDIHNHSLFGVDDGAKTIDDSVAMIKLAAEKSITDILLTPHNNYDEKYNLSLVKNNFAILKEELKNKNIDVNIYLANENYVSDDFMKLLEKKLILPINNKYILIEFSFYELVDNVIDIILELKMLGYTAIIAHPERCYVFQSNLALLIEAKSQGALIQSNIGSYFEIYGKRAKKVLKKLLKKDLVDILASDSHNLRIYEQYDNFIKKLERKIGHQKFNQLTKNNPYNVIKGKIITSLD